MLTKNHHDLYLIYLLLLPTHYYDCGTTIVGGLLTYPACCPPCPIQRPGSYRPLTPDSTGPPDAHRSLTPML